MSTYSRYGFLFCTLFLFLSCTCSSVTWAAVQLQKLVADDPSANAYFGHATSVLNNNLIIGAYQDANNAEGIGHGAAYIFTLNTTTETWQQQVKLTPPDLTIANSEQFGFSVSMGHNRVAIGAPRALVESEGLTGVVYVYDYDGAQWNMTARIVASDAERFDAFGRSVSLDGDQLLVGAPRDDLSTGAAYLFEFNGMQWVEIQKLRAIDASNDSSFGSKVIIKDDRAVVSADRYDDAVIGDDIGAVYVFEKTPKGWSPSHQLMAGDAAEDDWFGDVMSMSGNTLVIGAQLHDSSDETSSGAVYVFDYNTSTQQWNTGIKIVEPTVKAQNRFGRSVAIDGDKLLIGARRSVSPRSGAVFSYFFDGSDWLAIENIQHSDPTIVGDDLGTDISLYQGTAIFGTANDRDSSPDNDFFTGAAFVFDIDIKPMAVVDSSTVIEDSAPVSINLLDNDTDVDGGPLFIESITQANHGTVTLVNTVVNYQPNADYCNDGNIPDEFTYTLNGGSSATVHINVTCVDDPPVASVDMINVDEDSNPVIIDVLINDSDNDGGPLMIESLTQPDQGTVMIVGSGIQFQPNENYCNTGEKADTFFYTLNGGSRGDVIIEVNCIDDAPMAIGDVVTVNEDNAVMIDVLSNDTDVDGGPLFIESITQANHGTITLVNTAINYQPDADYCNDGNTADEFTYQLNGGSIGTVSIDVTCVDDLPVASVDNVNVNEDSNPVIIDVLSNDNDIDGGPLTIESLTQPQQGTVMVVGSGIQFQPNENYCNTGEKADTFFYTLNGGSRGDVIIGVNCIDDAPMAIADVVTVNEDNVVMIDVLSNDTDVDGGAISIESVTQPDHGTVNVVGNNLSYVPDDHYCNQSAQSDDFSYVLNGGSRATVAVQVNCVNDAPNFDLMGDIQVTLSDVDQNNRIIVSNFANNFNFGPDNESNQIVEQFLITVLSDSSGVIENVQLNNDGTLTVEFSTIVGAALLEVEMQDNGGTLNGGQNTSPSKTFMIAFSDVIFSNGFEDSCCNIFNQDLIDFIASNVEPTSLQIDEYGLQYHGHLLGFEQPLVVYLSDVTIKQWLQEVMYLIYGMDF